MQTGSTLFDEANMLHEEGKFTQAEAIYDSLLAQNHDNAGLLATLGTLYLKMGKEGLAISLLERAASQTPQGDIICNLGIAYRNSGQHAKCKEAFARAVKHNPTPDTIATYSSLFLNVGTPDECLKHANRALKMDENCALAHWNTAIAKLELGQWAEAWEHHEWGYKTKPPMRINRGHDLVPEWDGKSPGKVWVFGEQGIGDEIMFASIIPDVLKTNEVVFECHNRLETLFENSLGVKCIGTRLERELPEVMAENPDWRISVASLGKYFRTSRAAFPGTAYLNADAAPKGERFRVGISWTGGLKAGRVATRAVPLPWWASILDNDCEFVSLQYTECEDDIQAMKRGGYDIKEFREVKAHDYNETAKLVKSCDLVISVCTSVVHLAGALGVPCWVLTPNKPAWRYGVTGGMPWYRSVRLYRQPEGDKDAWKPVVSHVAADLSELLGNKQRMTA